MTETDLLQQAREAMQRGDKASARRLLADAIQHDPRDGTAWLWLSAVVDDPARERYCVTRSLNADPANELARRRWSWLHDGAKPVEKDRPLVAVATRTGSLVAAAPDQPSVAPDQATPTAQSTSRARDRNWITEWLVWVGILWLVMAGPVLSYWAMTGQFLASWPYAWTALATGIVLSGLLAWLGDRGARRKGA